MAFGSPDDEVIGRVGGRNAEKSNDSVRGFGGADDEIVKRLWTPAAIQEPTPAPAPPPLPQETLLGAGYEGLKGGLRTVGARALHAIGAPEWAGEVEKQAEENYARQATRPLTEIEENPWTWNSAKGIYEQAVASVPSMAPVLAGGLAGAKMGAVLGPWGVLGGSIIGGTAGAMPQLVGSNLKRATEEQKIPLKDTDLVGATGYALAQASMDSLLGGGLFGGAFKVPAFIAANVVSRMAAKAIQGGLTEGLTEAAQQWLEIMYANPEKAKAMPPEVIKEIRDSGIVGGAMGLFGGGVSGVKKPQADPSPPPADEPYGPFEPYGPPAPPPGPAGLLEYNPNMPEYPNQWAPQIYPADRHDGTPDSTGWGEPKPPPDLTPQKLLPYIERPDDYPNPYAPQVYPADRHDGTPDSTGFGGDIPQPPPGGPPPPGPSGPSGGPSGPAGPQAPPPTAPPPAAPVAPPAAPPPFTPTPKAPAGKGPSPGQQVFNHIVEQLRAVSVQEIAAQKKAGVPLNEQKPSSDPIQINAIAALWKGRYETLATLKGTNPFDEYRLENLSVQYGGDPNAEPEAAAPPAKRFLKKPTAAPAQSRTQFFNDELIRLHKRGVKDPVAEATKTTEAKYPTKATSAPAQTSYPAKRSSENDNSYYDRVVFEAYSKGMRLPEAKKFAEAATNYHWPPQNKTTLSQLGSAFRNWFGRSKVANEDGTPITLYHGTSKDKDFTGFKVGRHGAWFTTDPKDASQYAMQNDSMNSRYQGGKFVDYNTASRVMPVHVRIENPYTMTKADTDAITRASGRLGEMGYKKVQSDFFDQLRRQGYDGVNNGGGVWVVLKNANQIKSVHNRGTYDSGSNILKQDGDIKGPQEGLIEDRATWWANFKRWAKGAPLVEKPANYRGGPAVFKAYHGTTHGNIRRINSRKGDKTGALGQGFYVSTNPRDASANYGTREGPDVVHRVNRRTSEIDDYLTNLPKEERVKYLSEYLANNGPWDANSLVGKVLKGKYWPEAILSLPPKVYDALEAQEANNVSRTIAEKEIFGDTSGVLMPVYVRLNNPMDMRTSGTNFTGRDYTRLIKALNDLADSHPDADIAGPINILNNQYQNTGNVSAKDVYDIVRKFGHVRPDPEFGGFGQLIQDLAKELGHDGLIQQAGQQFVNMDEMTKDTLHVVPFSDNQIKSQFNRGTFDDTNRILKQNPDQKTAESIVNAEIELLPNSAIIRMYKSANVSSFMHESSHLWLRSMVKNAPFHTQIANDVEIIREWTGNKGEPFTAAQHEKFARGFELFLYSGRGPTAALTKIFKQFAAWLKGVYAKASDIRTPDGKSIEVPEHIMQVYERMFSVDEKTAADGRTSYSPNADPLPISGVAEKFNTAQTLEQDKGGQTEKVNLRTGTSRALKVLGETLYRDQIDNVSAKEIVQNSFDAIKAAQKKGTLKGRGKIEVFINKDTNTLTVRDNGIGMSTDTVKNAFFTVFGTDKQGLSPEESSGSYGVAKIAFLLGGKAIHLRTTRDGRTTEIKTNPAAIEASIDGGESMDMQTYNTPNVPNGTFVQVTFKDIRTKKDGSEVPFKIFREGYGFGTPDILEKKFIGDLDIYQTNTKENDPDKMRSGQWDTTGAADIKDFLPPKEMKFPWGTVQVYFGKETLNYSGGYTNVNNAGMPQFQWKVQDKDYNLPVMHTLINVLPKNRPGSDISAADRRLGSGAYPIRMDRENWSPLIAEDAAKIHAAILQESVRRKVVSDVKKMTYLHEMTYTPLNATSTPKWIKKKSTVTNEQIDKGKYESNTSNFNPDNPYFHSNLNVDVIKVAAEKHGIDPKRAEQFFAKFGSVVKDFAFTLGRVAKEGGETPFIAFMDGKSRFVGVSLDKGYRGVSTRVPFNGFFINPLALKRLDNVDQGKITSPRGIAARWYSLMVHEASHEIQRNHDFRFASQEINLNEAIADLPGPNPAYGHAEDLEALIFSYRKEITALADVYNDKDTKNLAESLGTENTQSQLETDNGYDYGVDGNGLRDEPNASQQGRNQGTGSLENQARENEDSGGMESPATESITLQQAAQQTPGQNPTSIYAINKASWKQNVKRSIKAFFDPFSEISQNEQYRNLRNLLGGAKSEATDQATKYKNLFSKLTLAEKGSVNTYFETPNADTNLVPASIRRETIDLKNYINGELKQKLIDNNLLPKDVASKNVDSYLPRLYLKHLLDGAGIKGSGMKASLAFAKKKGFKEPEALLAMGEIKDPGVRTFHAIYRTQRDLAVMDFLNKVSKNSDWALPQSLVTWNGKRVTADWLKREAADIRAVRVFGEPDPARKEGMLAIADDMDRVANEGIVALNRANYDQSKYTKLPDSYDYGPLRGMIVQNQIAEDIIGTNNFVNPNNTWDNWFGDRGSKLSRATSLWKTLKVPLNPPSQMRNVASNMILLHLSGVPIHKLGTYMVRSASDMRAGGKYFKIAKDFGVGNASMTEQELFAISEELQKLEANSQNGFAGWRAIYRGLLKGANSVTDFYQKLETWGKIAKIMHAMETKTKEHPNGMSAEQAVREANKWLFDYSEVHPFIKRARQSPIGMPFVTFSYKVIPLMYEVMTKHPTRLLPYVALAATVPALVAASNDIDGDDEERVRKSLAPGLRRKDNMFMLPWKDDNGKWQLIDVGYFLPWQMPYEMVKSTAKGGYNLATGNSKEAISNAADVFKASTLLSSPLFNIVSALTTGVDPFTNKPIADKRDPANKQVMDVTSYAWSLVAPSLFASYGALGQLVNKESGTGLNRYGEPAATYGQMAARAVGINTYSVDPAAQRARNIRMMQHDLREVKARMTTALSDRSLTPEQRRKVTEDFREELIYQNKELAKYAKETEMSPRLRAATARP